MPAEGLSLLDISFRAGLWREEVEKGQQVMKIFVAILAVFAAGSSVAAGEVEFVRGDGKVDVLIGGRAVTSYVYGGGLSKPVLVPVRSLSGTEVTRRWPLTELDGGSMDHEHHVGLFFCVDQVNGTNFWNYYRNPGGKEPKIKHVRFDEESGGEGRGELSVVSHWIDKKERFLLEERRGMTFVAGQREGEYAIDLEVDLKAQKERVVFEDIEEGVLAVRLSDYLREGKRSVSLHKGEKPPREDVSGTGRYFSSNGDETARNIWGKRARWVAVQGVKGGKVVGMAVLNHPASVNYPTYWHVRDYGLMSANPLGQGDFQRQRPRQYRKNKVVPLRLTLEPGETAHFRFMVIVYEGVRTTGQIEQRFREYVK